ncbi:MAG: aldo/keto reductase [Planctomycetota bacterium]|jgi:aryl-alcohol dehydrogenase-like predicted oxidoreductase
MRRRKLGNTELEVPVVTLGAWAVGGWYWGGADDSVSIAAIQAAVEAGINAVDTAPIYGFGRSERVLADALRGREDVVWMTKCGLRWDDPEARGEPFFEDELLDSRGRGTGRKVKVFRNSRPDSIKLECERSLERLRLERIDLYQVHWHDGTTPVEETMGALLDLRVEGKIGEIGVSNYWPETLEQATAALGDVPLASNQPRYNLVHRHSEQDVLPWALEHGIGTLAYSPLEQGILTGEVRPDRVFATDDRRPSRASFRPENLAAINGVLDTVVAPIAEAHSATLGQVALAWTIDQPGVTTVLAGARTEQQAIENAGAGALELSAEERATIRAAFEALELDLTE